LRAGPFDPKSGLCLSFCVAYQTDQGEFVAAAIVESFDIGMAREDAEAAGIHTPGALSTVIQVTGVAGEWIGRRLLPGDVARLLETVPKKPPARSIARRKRQTEAAG
jgi:hypothetical protein